MADRKTTLRMFTHMINMMEQHNVMTISCGDPLMELLKDVRELLKEQEAVEPKKIKGFNQPCYVHYAFICKNCRTDLIQGQPYCAGCGRPVKWEGD